MSTGLVVIAILNCTYKKKPIHFLYFPFVTNFLVLSQYQMVRRTGRLLLLMSLDIFSLNPETILPSHTTSMNWGIPVPCYKIKQKRSYSSSHSSNAPVLSTVRPSHGGSINLYSGIYSYSQEEQCNDDKYHDYLNHTKKLKQQEISPVIM